MNQMATSLLKGHWAGMALLTTLHKISNPSGSSTLYPLYCALPFSVAIYYMTHYWYVSLLSLSPTREHKLH